MIGVFRKLIKFVLLISPFISFIWVRTSEAVGRSCGLLLIMADTRGLRGCKCSGSSGHWWSAGRFSSSRKPALSASCLPGSVWEHIEYYNICWPILQYMLTYVTIYVDLFSGPFFNIYWPILQYKTMSTGISSSISIISPFFILCAISRGLSPFLSID